MNIINNVTLLLIQQHEEHFISNVFRCFNQTQKLVELNFIQNSLMNSAAFNILSTRRINFGGWTMESNVIYPIIYGIISIFFLFKCLIPDKFSGHMDLFEFCRDTYFLNAFYATRKSFIFTKEKNL